MSYTIKRPDNFDIEQIFDCGQCFRFGKHPEKRDTYCGVAFGKYLEITQSENEIIFNCDESAFHDNWHSFLDLDNNYSLYIDSFKDDKVLYEASLFSSGIRLLKQDPWETLCSFIISQNNNIPRIKGIIENMSKAFGESFEQEGNTYYSFPTAKALCDAGEEKIFSLKTGFRAKYIVDAVSKVKSGEVDLEKVKSLSFDEAKAELMKIKGVGEKVAHCVLLYGFHRLEGFPMDVWMKRAMAVLFPENKGEDFGGFAGIAQQYIFHYARLHPEIFENS